MLIVLISVCIGLDVARELCFKLGADADARASSRPAQFAMFGQSGWTVCGFACWGVELIAWTYVLTRLPLNVAFPIMSLTYALTPLAGWLLLNEAIDRQRWIGIGLITTGAAIVGATGID
jgi:multidrug transporter EmrE-like cation transporter